MIPGYLLVSGVLAILLALSIIPRLKAAGAVPFFGVLVGIGIYSFGYGMELVTPPGGANLLWNHVQYLGSSAIPAFWIWLALETPRPDRLPGPAVPVALLLIPAVTLALNLTNEQHHFYYRSLEFSTREGLTMAAIVPGPWYWVQAAYTVGAFVVGLVVYAGAWWRHRAGSPSRHLGVILATLPTLAAYLLYQLTDLDQGFDLIPLGLSVTAFLFFWLLWPFGLYDLRPVSREAVFHLVPDPVVVVDPADRLVDWNPAAARLFPVLEEQRGSPPVSQVFAGLPQWLEALGADPPDQPVPVQGPSGPTWWAVTRSPVLDAKGRPLARIVLLHEQTDLVTKAEGLERQALTDPLTGCLNRRGFLARAAEVSSGGGSGAVSMIGIDLDHFKAVNDERGHAAGDAALRHVVRVWQSQLRAGEVLGRLGGEEFSVFLPSTGHDVALVIAGRLCQALRTQPLLWEGGKLPLTASFGVTGGPRGTPVEALLRNADAALYEAKARGRNRVVLGCLTHDQGAVQACVEPETP